MYARPGTEPGWISLESPINHLATTSSYQKTIRQPEYLKDAKILPQNLSNIGIKNGREKTLE